MGQESVTEADQAPGWGFQAGNLALDFANTVDWHASEQPVELIHSYADLVQWSLDFQVLGAGQAGDLLEAAKADPQGAAAALGDALALRDAIYNIFAAMAHDREPTRVDLIQLKYAYVQAVSTARLEPAEGTFSWRWPQKANALNAMLWPIAGAGLDLLRSADLQRVGQCADARGCGALFLDTSRNRSRQWCSMETCGNRAKAQRHYRRQKKSGAGQ